MASVSPRRQERERANPAPRRRLNSFDVFDTLIARRCAQPAKVFEAVEARSGVRGFAAARVAAEASLARQPHTLDTIYAALGDRLTLSAEAAGTLRALEMAVELDNAIPIAENIAAVEDGDMLISDMYLGAGAIRELLGRAGFDKTVALVVSADGKASGRVWPEILAIADIGEHRGDNLHSDVAMAERAGVKSRHTDVATPNRVETVLYDVGLTDLAGLSREVRLASWAPEPEIRALQIAQANYNLPILILSSLLVLHLAARQRAKRLLFSSRDGNLWLALCRAIAGLCRVDIEMDYFYTSRLARLNPSPDYLDYARRCIDEKTIVTDLCGTGWSLAHLFETIGRRDQGVAFLHALPARADYERVAPTPGTARIFQLLAEVEGCNNTAIEMCNYAKHGMALDVRKVCGCEAPIFAPDPRSERTRRAIEAQHRVAHLMLKALGERGLRETLTCSDESLARLGGALYRGLAHNPAVYRAYIEEHVREDDETRRKLGCLA